MAQYNLSSSQPARIRFDEWARQDAIDAFVYFAPEDFRRIRDDLWSSGTVAGRPSDQDVVAWIAQQRFALHLGAEQETPWVDDFEEAVCRYHEAFEQTYLDLLRETSDAATH